MQAEQSAAPEPIRELTPEDLERVAGGRSNPYATFKFRMAFPSKMV